jgi:hypothetical protein
MTDEVESIKRYVQENFIQKNSMVDNFRKHISQERRQEKEARQRDILQKEQKEIIKASKNIISFPQAVAKPVEKPKIRLCEQIIVDARCTILDDWRRHAKTNKLLQYFVFSLPIYTRQDVNYLNNMSEIVAIEKLMGYTPKVSVHGENGFDVADFYSVTAKMGRYIISAPEMTSEEYARAIMILVYNKVKRDLSAEGIETHKSISKYGPKFFDSRQ